VRKREGKSITRYCELLEMIVLYCKSTTFEYRSAYGEVGVYALNEVKSCGACKSVYYCSQDCQNFNWKTRQKPLCQAHSAAQRGTA
jgi:hypothetical protein